MATSAQISMAEYLATGYRPDRDYVDGELVERNGGEYDHGRLQALLVIWFGNHEQELGIRVVPEQRVQVAATRFRVPDVCVIAGPAPPEQILTSPPLVCIEILSKDDRIAGMQERVDDYLAFGVPYVWLVDPRTRKAWRCTSEGQKAVTELRIEAPQIVLPLGGLFERLRA